MCIEVELVLRPPLDHLELVLGPPLDHLDHLDQSIEDHLDQSIPLEHLDQSIEASLLLTHSNRGLASAATWFSSLDTRDCRRTCSNESCMPHYPHLVFYSNIDFKSNIGNVKKSVYTCIHVHART